MARNGSNSGAVVDVTGFLAEQAQRAARLKELAREQQRLQKEADRLAKVNEEIAQLMSGNKPTTPAPKRQPAKGNGGKKGAKASKGAKKGAKASKATGNGTRGITTYDALLQVLPNNDVDGISKGEAVAAIQKLGWQSTADNPPVVVGQTLGRFKDFQNPERGKWRLSATGMKNRDKANSAPAAAAADAPKADDSGSASAGAASAEGASAPPQA